MEKDATREQGDEGDRSVRELDQDIRLTTHTPLSGDAHTACSLILWKRILDYKSINKLLSLVLDIITQ